MCMAGITMCEGATCASIVECVRPSQSPPRRCRAGHEEVVQTALLCQHRFALDHLFHIVLFQRMSYTMAVVFLPRHLAQCTLTPFCFRLDGRIAPHTRSKCVMVCRFDGCSKARATAPILPVLRKPCCRASPVRTRATDCATKTLLCPPKNALRQLLHVCVLIIPKLIFVRHE
jgi:hypothetical protein